MLHCEHYSNSAQMNQATNEQDGAVDSLLLFQRPRLRNPSLVMGFAGWPNAAEVSTASVSYLKEKLGAEKLGEVAGDKFLDFSSVRPVVTIEGGLIKGLSFPTNELFCWKNDKADHDLLLMVGIEPNLRWGEFIDCILEVVEQFEVKMVYTLGGVYDSVPHTREPRISAAVSDSALLEKLKGLGLELTDYEGPSSIHTSILAACKERNVPGLSLWGSAPYYVQIPNPKVSLAVLRLLTRLLNIEVDLTPLQVSAERLEHQINAALADNAELSAHITKLEEAYEARIRYEPMESAEILRGVEEFLRRQKRGEN